MASAWSSVCFSGSVWFSSLLKLVVSLLDGFGHRLCLFLSSVHRQDFPLPPRASSIIKGINLWHLMPCYDTVLLPTCNTKHINLQIIWYRVPFATGAWNYARHWIEISIPARYSWRYLYFNYRLIAFFCWSNINILQARHEPTVVRERVMTCLEMFLIGAGGVFL